MALPLAFAATAVFVVFVESLMRRFESCEDRNPRDSYPSSVVAIVLWMLMLMPLFFSYG